jgi:hypothetical protein
MLLINIKSFELFKHFRKYIFNNVLMVLLFHVPFSALLLVRLLRFRQFV